MKDQADLSEGSLPSNTKCNKAALLKHAIKLSSNRKTFTQRQHQLREGNPLFHISEKVAEYQSSVRDKYLSNKLSTHMEVQNELDSASIQSKQLMISIIED